MSYQIKEIFYTLQGEGYHAGRPAVFCRFAGCNLWSGREQDRAKAQCQFCDTDFVGTDGTLGGKYSAADLAAQIAALWPTDFAAERLVVLTGGEPLLQLDEALITALPQQIVQSSGDELKLVWPQPAFDLASLERLDFKHFYLQPMDGPQQQENIALCIAQCLQRPKWKLSLQTHKITGIR